MSSKGRTPVPVYAAALVQGVVLVTFPAASTIFTSASPYGLTSTQYGAMFLPQAVTAVGLRAGPGRAEPAARREAGVPGRAGRQPGRHDPAHRQPVRDGQPAGRVPGAAAGGDRVPGRGLRAHRAVDQHVHRRVPPGRGGPLGARTQLAARAGHRAGPGVRGDLRRPGVLGGRCRCWPRRAVIAPAPPACSLRLPLRAAGTRTAAGPDPSAAPARTRTPIPAAFWLFAGFAVLYGFCETMNGNWSQLDLTSLKVSATVASLALTVFWAMVTAGRVLFAVIQRWFPEPARVPPAAVRAGRGVRADLGPAVAGPGGGRRWPSRWPGSAARRCCR